MQIADLELLISADAVAHLIATRFDAQWTLDAVLRTGASRTLATARGPARRFASLDTLVGVLSSARGLELRITL